MPVKILSTADLHIGRTPTRVPDAVRTQSSCARMWSAVVELAIREEVDLVTLSGDVVDHANRFFEATGPLETGIAQLAAAGIDTYAVAGNHDYDVLPRIVDAVGTDRFHLLGNRLILSVMESPNCGSGAGLFPIATSKRIRWQAGLAKWTISYRPWDCCMPTWMCSTVATLPSRGRTWQHGHSRRGCWDMFTLRNCMKSNRARLCSIRVLPRPWTRVKQAHTAPG